ncbi:tyrosine phosphatase family protein [Ancylobacter sp. 6x-1]|uniref:Tyrosine phosphatase family protein n=1 Tax=Ancylobacter crimeensis TaxID=2579147 RepID=A0ABT0DDI3_9HYPH|nr:tyrosine phosphatase family protein [Ancylobacter crimeensis]MCK0198029.1 tyrosine phosphatase family protein [Ancylobacter crimeensis]
MIHVCPLSRLEETVQRTGAAHVLTVINHGTAVTRPASITPDNHLFIGFNDITTPQDGLVRPAAEHVDAILGFARRWPRQAPLVVHCFAGISRSTASAYIAACALNPDRNEARLAAELREASPSATPNALLIALADAALGRQGRMIAAIASIGRGADAFEGNPFFLRLD